jgi:hypothetical protein
MRCARLEEVALSLHPEKTRLIEFGRHAATDRRRQGLGKPETLTFLGSRLSAEEHAGGDSSFNGKPGATVCKRSSRKSRRSYGVECIGQFPNKGVG